MSNYYEMKDAKVRIANELMLRGWKVYGYHTAKYDPYADYQDSDQWNGIATKNGYILVIDNSTAYYSNKNIEKYNPNNTLSYYDREKISKLEAMTQQNGTTAGEEENAKRAIEKIKSKIPNNKSPYEVVDLYPEYMANPGKSKWHIEKNGSLYDKGTGIVKYADIPEQYVYDINKMEYTENYKRVKEWNKINNDWEWVDRELPEETRKLISEFKSLILKWERIVNGQNTCGDGTKETAEQAVEQSKPLEKVIITNTVIVLKMVEIDRKTIQVGDYITMSYHGGYWKVTKEYMRTGKWKVNGQYVEMEKKCFNYEIVGSEKKKFQTLKNAKGYYQYEEQMLKEIEKGSIKIFELKEVEEVQEVEKYIDTKKKVRAKKEKENKEVKKTTSKIQESEITETISDDLNNENKKVDTFTAGIEAVKINLNEDIKENATMDTKTYVDMMQNKLKNEITAKELQEYYTYLRENEIAVKELIMDKLNNSEKYKRKRKTTKEELTSQCYDNMIMDLVYTVQETFSMVIDFSGNHKETERKAIEKIIFSATDEQIKKTLEKKQQRNADYQERKNAIIEAIKNPQTLEDFKQVFQYRKTPLTPEEQERYDYLYSIDQKEKREVARQEKQKVDITVSTDDYNIIADVDTRDNSPLWTVKLNNRVSSEEFKNIQYNIMKPLGGNYSRFKGGFIFRYDPTSKLAGEETEATERQEIPITNVERLRKVADNMDNTIEDLRRERKTNTYKRMNEAANAESKAESLEYKQELIYNIANAIENNEVEFINKIDSKAQIDTLEQILLRASLKQKEIEKIDYNTWKQTNPTIDIIKYVEIPSSEIYLDELQSIINDIKNTDGFKLVANRLQKVIDRTAITDKDKHPKVDITEFNEEFDKIYKNTDTLKGQYFESYIEERKRLERMGIESIEELRAYLREYWKYRDVEIDIDPVKKKIKELEREYKLSQKGDIHFTTNKQLLDQLLELVDIQENDVVLEPSAGIGSIADRLKEYTNNIEVCEYMFSYTELLKLKGYKLIENDFLQLDKYNYYDKIVANVPFSVEQEHIKHIFNVLKPGGKAVIITSSHYTFASDKKSQEFRNWLDTLTYEITDVPEKSFDFTNVNCKILIIDKDVNVRQVAI